jgi:transposase
VLVSKEIEVFASHRVTGLGFYQEIPHHSTFSKNRHGRFGESDVFEQLFEGEVSRCMAAGRVHGEHLSVDSSLTETSASRSSLNAVLKEIRHKCT